MPISRASIRIADMAGVSETNDAPIYVGGTGSVLSSERPAVLNDIHAQRVENLREQARRRAEAERIYNANREAFFSWSLSTPELPSTSTFSTCQNCRQNVEGLLTTINLHGRRATIAICEDCVNRHTRLCSNCDNRIENNGLCPRCQVAETQPVNTISSHTAALKEKGRYAITDYHPKFPWEYFDDKTDIPESSWFGIELEIEARRAKISEPQIDSANTILDRCARLVGRRLDKKAICSHDGSLRDGFEIVVTPHKKQAFRKLNFRALMIVLKEADAVSHEGARCGFHIHIEKDEWLLRERFREFYSVRAERTHAIVGTRSFGRKYPGIYYNYDLYQRFFNVFEEEITLLSKRTRSQISDYCRFERSRDAKYLAVCTSREKTIEVRIWRGTLDHDQFKMCLQFSFAVLDFLKQHSAVTVLTAGRYHKNELAANFNYWLSNQPEYQFLVQFLKEKELFNFKKEKKNVRNSRKTNKRKTVKENSQGHVAG